MVENTQNIEQLTELALKIYTEIQNKDNIEQNNQGKYIAIDVESKRYFIGDTRDEALQKAKAELPNVVFFVKRIGGVDRVSRNYPYPAYSKLVHARIL